ncbi:hypothetical protein D3C79_939230 [compost metagenome]
MYLVTPGLELARHQVSGGELFKAQFRMGVDVSAQGDHLFFECTNAGQGGQIGHQILLVFIGRFRLLD